MKEEQNNQEQKEYIEKINYCNALLASIMNIGRAVSFGLSGKAEIDYLKSILIPEIWVEIQDKISNLDARFDRYLVEAPSGGFTMRRPNPKTEIFDFKIKTRFGYYEHHNTEPPEPPHLKTLSDDDKHDLFQTLRSQTTGAATDAAHGAYIIIGDAQYVHWLERRHVLQELKIIINSPTMARMLLTSQRQVESGYLSGLDDLPDKNKDPIP